MKEKVKYFILENKRVSFNEICLFLRIDTIKHEYQKQVRDLDCVLRELIIEDFAVFHNGKYCLRKNKTN